MTSPHRRHWHRARQIADSWRHDKSLHIRLMNISHLLSGNFVSGLISLAAVALTARAIGPASYGILALTITYCRAVERLLTFQSWQPLIKYGAALNDPAHRDDFRMLLKFGLLLDLAGAGAAWLVAVSLALLAHPLFGWDPQTMKLVVIYCTVLLFNISGTPTAVLRLYGRFRTAAYGPVISALLRLILCMAGIALHAGFAYFVFVWMGMQIVGAVTFLLFGLRTLRQNGVTGVHRAPIRGVTQRFPGLWNFAWTSNLSLTLRSSAQQLDTLLVGALADPASAGLYHIAKQVGRMAQQIGTHVQAVLYPDVARLWAASAIAEFRRAVLQTEIMLAGFGIAVFAFLLLTARPLLIWTAGAEFADAAPLLIAQAAAVALMLSGFPARSALLAMGRQRQILNIALAGTAMFHITALILIPRIGAMGANVAHIVMGLIWCIALALLFRQGLRHAGEYAPIVPD